MIANIFFFWALVIGSFQSPPPPGEFQLPQLVEACRGSTCTTQTQTDYYKYRSALLKTGPFPTGVATDAGYTCVANCDVETIPRAVYPIEFGNLPAGAVIEIAIFDMDHSDRTDYIADCDGNEIYDLHTQTDLNLLWIVEDTGCYQILGTESAYILTRVELPGSDPTPTPSPSLTPGTSITPSPTPIQIVSPSPTPTGQLILTPTPTASASPSPTATSTSVITIPPQSTAIPTPIPGCLSVEILPKTLGDVQISLSPEGQVRGGSIITATAITMDIFLYWHVSHGLEDVFFVNNPLEIELPRELPCLITITAVAQKPTVLDEEEGVVKDILQRVFLPIVRQ